jgi:hypothetical protein
MSEAERAAIQRAHAAGARDGRAGLGPVPPRKGAPGSLATRLHLAYMQSYRDEHQAEHAPRASFDKERRRRTRNRRPPDDLTLAKRIYRQFREADPTHARRVAVSLPRAVAHIGTVEFVGYMTTHRGKVHLYVHDFAPGSRPALYAGTRRNQLYLFGGRFKVTARGITDLDARGRVTEYTPRYSHDVKKR